MEKKTKECVAKRLELLVNYNRSADMLLEFAHFAEVVRKNSI